MSTNAASPTPHDLRLLAREQQYGNSNLEVETVKQIDALVFEKVRTYEAAIVEAAEDFVANAADDMTAAKEIGFALAEEVRQALDSGADPTAVAKRFEALRRDAETALGALERAERESAWHAEKLQDPYAGYSMLMQRYPILRPALAV
ncbi:hypothetical protein FQ330_03980 [Agrococcus sediminis]|uniref:Uncharacterized protein n=1 Tax=Agrococcus sediminis TaxID=2599924 RepID=A0A5M8QKY2_9MICO|nr:hypothetical protein [Agrococcus sediminis]KAA6434932.1 hypothetical protein FQ330_03980 [Agrococcus sediminis]